MFTLAIIVFVVSLLLIIVDFADKTVVAVLGALALMVFGVLSWEEAILAIDFETIALLLGLMLVVAVAQHSGMFGLMNTKIAQISKGNPLAIFVLFLLMTGLASTVLNNATVVLLVIPVAIALSNGLGLNTKLIVIGIALFSNIGGTLTLIGDPPNTIIGIQAGLSFMSFVKNLWVPILIMTFVIFGYLILVNWQHLRPISNNLSKLVISDLIIKRITYQYSGRGIDKYLVFIALAIILLSLIAFIAQPLIGLNVGLIGLISGFIIAILVYKKVHFLELAKEIEWDSLLFFAALFIQVAALEKVGFLEMITQTIASFSGSYVTLLLVIIWGIGLASMFINNIPFVALMIPVIFDLQEQLAGQPNLDLLWWALALGACLGGNGTIVGSSSGILAVDLAKKQGVKVSFNDFAKVGIPVTIISLAIASLYIVARVYI